jgi:DNA-binding transcriptional MerR regulator
MKYTIKDIAELAGVTTRTLRYYDEIDLLHPAEIGDNGYRHYDQTSLLKLQQILFYRELDVPLKDIKMLLSDPNCKPLLALEKHRSALQQRVKRLQVLIETVERTIATMKGESMMTDKEYFQGFDETKYEEEVRERWGDGTRYAESQKKWSSYSADEKEAIKAKGGRLTVRMVADAETAPDDPAVQEAVGDYFAYLNRYFYSCDLSFLRNLADMWVTDSRYAVNYERIREGGASFVRDAVHIYCDWNG